MWINRVCAMFLSIYPNMGCFAASSAKGNGWQWHANSCYSRNEQGISNFNGDPCPWTRSVSSIALYSIYKVSFTVSGTCCPLPLFLN
jgi:hypothetical protein